jgi:hypothetical protein
MSELFLIVSHALNIVLAGSVGIFLLIQHPSMEKNFGWDSPARQMFASIYITITLVSITALLFRTLIDEIAFVLFPIQIVYAILCLFTVRSKRNPMLWLNFLLALVLGLAFTSMFIEIF